MKRLCRNTARPLRNSSIVVAMLAICACSSLPPPSDPLPARSMGVTRGPELVFDQPVEAVMPPLAGAVATGRNGRVGGELVFWSYRLQDGSDVLFLACAELEGVDCAARTQLVCPAGTPTTLHTGSMSGEVRELQCRAVAQVAPGELRPNCLEDEISSPLVLGLVSCP
jgi:hypothetical protein